MNLGQVRTQARKRLGDATSAFWTDAELNGYINDGQRDISFRTKCIRANGYITTVSCDANAVATVSNEYPLASNFTNIYAVLEVYFHERGDQWIRLEPTNREELDRRSIAWRGNVGYVSGSTYNYDSKTSTPTEYYWSREEDIIGLNPPPNDDNAGTDYLRVYYAVKSTDAVDDADELTIAEPLHLAVINYVTATGFEDRGWGDRANDQWEKYRLKLRDYQTERNREREDDVITSVSYRS